jgi:hypothetical protein
MKLKRIGVLFVSSAMMALIALIVSVLGQQQRPSPKDSTEFVLNGKKITVVYSRPSMRGRKIMGGLVPYNAVWRTGANEATKLTTEADVVIGDATVPAGSYSLFTVPSEKSWKLIINKQTGQSGLAYDEARDLARVDMKVEALTEPVEQFTISFAPAQKGAVLKLEWETTRASVELWEKK